MNRDLQKHYELFLKEFPMNTLKKGGEIWNYRISERGKPTLLLLPGGTGSGNGFFMHFLDLQKQFTVITINFAPVITFQQIVNAVIAILDYENVDSCHVLGQSFGGIIAQQLLHQQPERLEKIILSHTSTNTEEMAQFIQNDRLKRLKKNP